MKIKRNINMKPVVPTPPQLIADFYKFGHRFMLPPKTEVCLSTWTPRTSRIKGVSNVVVFAMQAFFKTFLITYFNENFFDRPKAEVIAEYYRFVKYTLFVDEPDTSHIEALHDLGYLPLCIKALPEGTLCPIRVPYLIIYNTHKDFAWLTNFIETIMSASIWQGSTVATIALEFRRILDKYAMLTVGNTDFVPFQAHDFCFRGKDGLEAAQMSQMGHLLSFYGTDTAPAIFQAENLYNADIEKEMVGTSVYASEHGIQCAYGDDDEYIRHMLQDVFPTGIISLVCDAYDFWNVMSVIIPKYKELIMSRDGKFVVRHDTGDPVLNVTGYKILDNRNGVYHLSLIKNEIQEKGYEAIQDDNGFYIIDYDKSNLIGTQITEQEAKGMVESLWDIFGGTISETGYKLLDSHIGAIYGDAITLDRAEAICQRLMDKGFASINVVLGVGSFSYQLMTRDTQGFALKTTFNICDGAPKMIFKDPKTGDGVKTSLRGNVSVTYDGTNIRAKDLFDVLEPNVDGEMLIEVFRDGELLVDQNFSDIKARLASEVKRVYG